MRRTTAVLLAMLFLKILPYDTNPGRIEFSETTG